MRGATRILLEHGRRFWRNCAKKRTITSRQNPQLRILARSERERRSLRQTSATHEFLRDGTEGKRSPLDSCFCELMEVPDNNRPALEGDASNDCQDAERARDRDKLERDISAPSHLPRDPSFTGSLCIPDVPPDAFFFFLSRQVRCLPAEPRERRPPLSPPLSLSSLSLSSRPTPTTTTPPHPPTHPPHPRESDRTAQTSVKTTALFGRLTRGAAAMLAMRVHADSDTKQQMRSSSAGGLAKTQRMLECGHACHAGSVRPGRQCELRNAKDDGPRGCPPDGVQ